MNYFNYFTEIEDAFIRRRGKHLLLSPLDWALIESWKEINVPLHVALRGIEKAFDSWESKPRKRAIKSLLYCQEEVEAQFAEWRESRVGSAADTDEKKPDDNSGLPFSRSAILEHLRRGQAGLQASRARLAMTSENELTEALARAEVLVAALEHDLESSAAPDAQKLEHSLTGVERMLADAAHLVISPEQLDTLKAEVKDQLKPYRKKMDKHVYQQTFNNLLLKRLREDFGIPRLSLFYL